MSRDVASHFADYSALVAGALGDVVPTFLTINEPKTVVEGGYRYGEDAPGERDPDLATTALHHLLLGHGLAAQAIRAAAPAARVGLALNLAGVYPADPAPAAAAAATVRDCRENRVYLDAVFRGEYPADVGQVVSRRVLNAVVRPEDLAVMSSPIDVLGVNYYTSYFIGADGQRVLRHPVAEPARWLEVYPPGLYDVLTRVHRDYWVAAVAVTENGRPTSARLQDDDRIAFLRDHLSEAHRAMSAGVPLVGFYAWSLLDNFEWAEGYSQRFGLVHVDFDTQERTPRASARWYSRVARSNSVTC